MNRPELIAALEALFIEHSPGGDGSHDIGHARRVMAKALEIAEREGGGDEEVIIAAAYLHDLVNLPKNHPDRAKASALSAEAAGPLLAGIGFHADKIAMTQHAILTHSFSANLEPQTLEARAIQDSDRLEALGAIGIARTFAIAGQMGTDLFHGEDPFAGKRALNDKAYAVDHFAVKLFQLPTTMKTQAGRAIAEERAAMMREFLAVLGGELGSVSSW